MNHSFQTDCFVLCYSISYKVSFERVVEKWIPENRHFSLNVPIVLIGECSEECFCLLTYAEQTHSFLCAGTVTNSDRIFCEDHQWKVFKGA